MKRIEFLATILPRKIDNSLQRFEQIDTSAKRSKNFDEIPTVERRDECEQCAIEVGKLKGEGLERPDWSFVSMFRNMSEMNRDEFWSFWSIPRDDRHLVTVQWISEFSRKMVLSIGSHFYSTA